MQFGIELFGFKWSPVKYVYKQWAGLYEEDGKYLYVNRGFGFHGLRGRIGIWPEITVLTLKRIASAKAVAAWDFITGALLFANNNAITTPI